VIVWNEAQKREAIRLHHVPAARVRVTGAQLFDDWFDRRPATTREEFCHRIGLRPDRPFFLYLCSSLFIARDEVPFVRRWIESLRTSRVAALRECGVLVRPHPGHAGAWADADLSGLGSVIVWPRRGEMPLFDAAKADYFDSLFHSAGVVAVNTSGMIEAGIVGRRSFTILAPEFAATQSGTLHFAHLTAPGFLVTAQSFDEHHRQLETELTAPSTGQTLLPFIEQFVRPLGIESPATPYVADAIEELAAVKTVAARTPVAARVLRPLLTRLIESEPPRTHPARGRSIGS
jgi:hypothetical protein